MSGPAKVSPVEFAEELGHLLAAARFADVWRKLALAEADERHLFLGVTLTSPWPVYQMLQPEISPLPDIAAPHLPEPVTSLWLMSVPLALRCLHWSPAVGWLDARDHWKTP